jgi:cell wall-associated NlpC family hydrolase
MTKTEKAVQWMVHTANNPLHGYDQKYRWGERGDYDCSSAVITAWETAGVPVKSAGATYTGNMYSAFKKCGFDDVTKMVNLKIGTGLLRGDVLLNRKYHTAMYIGDGKIAQASINEKGTAVGGAPGDQTGKEFLIRSYYNYPWDYVLRYHETAGRQIKKKESDIAREVIWGLWGNGSDRIRRLRNAGYNPEEIQRLVNKMILG